MKHLYRQKSKVSFEERCLAYKQKPAIFWFTGLSGAGKSTIADAFEKVLFDWGYFAYRLDADDLRQSLNSDLGFSMADREENIRRAAEVARILQEAGLIVLASFISPTENSREIARKTARKGLFYEVYIKADLKTCVERDPKGFYKKAHKGEIKDYTGIDSIYDEPVNPDLVIDTDEDTVEKAVGKLVLFARESNVISKDIREWIY
jgi:adenylyl-sulfate kinase